jgi:ribosome-dependent ATPase
VLAQVDGAMTFRGETVAQYVKGSTPCCRDPARPTSAPQQYTADIENRYMYNPTFESIYSIVPSVPALLLLLIPAILMTVAIVREKELGSMINFYVTPTGKVEYLVGKQLPYIAIGMINFFILARCRSPSSASRSRELPDADAVHPAVRHGHDRLGMVTSTFTSSQVAAVFVTAILTITPTIQFSGCSSRSRRSRAAPGGRLDLAGLYYMHSSLGAYTKGCGPASCWGISSSSSVAYPSSWPSAGSA